ncbi:MAG: alpha/beta fold hydrolase, partial [Anaerolineales bacterium]
MVCLEERVGGVASAMLPAWHGAATASRSRTTARTDGDAPTVILVHGWAGNRTFWSRQVDVLTERYHVVTVDLGGHGESGTGRGDW